MSYIAKFEEGERQVVLLALAKLSVERPGWLDMIERIALKMDNRTAEGKPAMLYEFRRIHEDVAMVRKPLSASKQELAAAFVRGLYAGFNVEMLEEILAVGRKYEAESDAEEVLYMNEALAAEIERRKVSQ